MAEESKAGDGDSALLARLNQIEAQLDANEELRKRFRNYSLIGVCLVLFFLTLFVYRLYNYATNYDTEALVAQMQKEADGIFRPELEILMKQIEQEKLLQNFWDEFRQELDSRSPELQAAGEKLMEGVEQRIRTQVEDKLLDTLIKSIEGSSDEVKNIFPNFSGDELEKQLRNSTDYFVDKLADAVEERVALVSSSLEGLKSSVEIVRRSSKEELTPEMKSQVEEMLIDALLDLVIYEIKPELGAVPVDAMEGGAK